MELMKFREFRGFSWTDGDAHFVRTHYYIGRSAMAGFAALLTAQALGDVKMMNDRSVVDFIESVRPV